MKILLLADPDSAHTIKWVTYLCGKRVEIYLFGLGEFNSENYPGLKNFHASSLKIKKNFINRSDGNLSKIRYLAALPKIKKIIKEFSPDIVHAHYSSSYGLLGALCGFSPLIISVYGADVYNFPDKSFIHKKIFKYNLSKSQKILSTSSSMACEIKKFTSKEIEITPFGIDVEKFKPFIVESIFKPGDIVVGTIKTLEKKYGVEYLIRAFRLVKDSINDLQLKLLVVGDGSLKNHLKEVAKNLSLEKDIVFTGYISPVEIPKYHNMIDVFVALSIEDSESFGVAVLEALACEKPVVVSNVSGFSEVVQNNLTGLIVERKNIQEAANAILKLVTDKDLRDEIGRRGRAHVSQYFNWNNNIEQMINIYKQFI